MTEADLYEYRLSEPFSLADTLKSGQLFHWEPVEFAGISGFAGCIGDQPPTFVSQPATDLVLLAGPDIGTAVRYFGLDHRLSEIQGTFPVGDLVLASAIAFCPGIRIARQPLWECLATFITSSLKQVAHIRAISLALRQNFGHPHHFAGRVLYSYPDPESIVAAGEEALRRCALGYRAKSLHLTASAIVRGEIDLAAVEGETDLDTACAALMQCHGVGEKIANCSLLFGCGQWGAFPIDVWIERILRQLYRKRVKGPKLQAWAVKHFGPNAGYAQQYLFHFARKTL